MSAGSTGSDEDLAYLERARLLARAGWGHVHPNPLVGCVLVRDGEVIGEGYHAVFGGPHAEIVALERARAGGEGATAYVSLEPCDHTDKTPACSEALIAAGIRRVVFGALDPHPEAGGGAEALRRSGVEVLGPLWDPSVARCENPAFFHTLSHRSPYVALKLAMSLDGRIASGPGERTQITGTEAEQEVHRLRTGFDAVMIGAETARVDDPRLTVRRAAQGRVAPRRIVLDTRARLQSGAALFEDIEAAPLHVFSRLDASEAEAERLETAGAQVHPVGGGPCGLDLREVLSVCWDLGVRSILCEGGARLAQSLLREGHASRLYLFVAPMTIGAGGVPAFEGPGLPWHDFDVATDPSVFGRDTLMVFDRRES